MSVFKKLFSRQPEPRQRVRVCVECGMPVAEHKDWCSIWQHQQAEESRKTTAGKGPAV